MKILIACEYSGRVREAFAERGHYVVSCDVLPTDAPTGPNSEHRQTDILELLDDDPDWDLMVAFPPCTRLSSIGAAYWPKWQADGSQQKAIDFFMSLALAPIPRVAVENPSGIMSRLWRKPDQYIQPWWYGDPWQKRTGIWVRGLEPLATYRQFKADSHWVDGGTYNRPGQSGRLEGAYSGTARTNRGRAHERSKTFPGIARAMACQWSCIDGHADHEEFISYMDDEGAEYRCQRCDGNRWIDTLQSLR